MTSVALTALFDRLTSSNEVLGAVAAAFVTGIFSLAFKLFASKPKVQWCDFYENHYLLPKDDGTLMSVYVRDVWIQNTGTQTAKNVEVSLNFKPQHFEVFPHVPYSIHVNNDHRHIFNFKILNRKEFVRISLHSVTAILPLTTNVRFEGGLGKRMNAQLQIVYPNYINYSIFALVMLGVFSIFYLFIRIVISAAF